MPHAVVVDPAFDWEDDRPPRIPWNDSVIYELHVKGFTKRLATLPEHLRGTYAGLASDEAIAYLRELGVTAVELLPVHHIVDESFLVERGPLELLGLLVDRLPRPARAVRRRRPRSASRSTSSRAWSRPCTAPSIEVILDVVYNHTAEGNHLGPMLSFKGIDNPSYYRLMPDDPRYYMDFTGTGNSLNPVHPSALRLIMDSLRHFVTEYHVDGFRFDLASALARELYEVDRLSSFFDTIHQDPVLSQVKLIAEPWDVGPGGYQVGNFPVLLERVERRSTATRCATSGAARRRSARSPRASPARRTCTATAAGRSRRSTSSPRTTASRCAISSPTTRSTTRPTSRTTATAPTTTAAGTAVSRARPTIPRSSRCARASSATCWPRWCSRRACRCCSAATSSAARRAATTTPGARTTRSRGSTGSTSTASCSSSRARLIRLRREQPVFRRRDFLVGSDQRSGLPDVVWLRSDGVQLDGDDWKREDWRSLAVFLNGEEIPSHSRRGAPIRGDSFLIAINSHHDGVAFTMPDRRFGERWAVELATDGQEARTLAPGEELILPAYALAVLRRHGRSFS